MGYLDNPPLNIILTKVSIVREDRDDYDYFNIHELDSLNLTIDDYQKCRFFQVDGIIDFDNKKYKIKKITFRLNPIGETLRQNFDIHHKEPTYNNATLLVFVDEYFS